MSRHNANHKKWKCKLKKMKITKTGKVKRGKVKVQTKKMKLTFSENKKRKWKWEEGLKVRTENVNVGTKKGINFDKNSINCSNSLQKFEISPHDRFFSTDIIRDILDKYEVWDRLIFNPTWVPWGTWWRNLKNFVQRMYFSPIQSNFCLFTLNVSRASHKTTIFKLAPLLNPAK